MIKQRGAALLLLALLLAALLGSAHAEGGIRAALLTDKDSYAASETIQAWVHIDNENSFALGELSVQFATPVGAELVSGDPVQQRDTLPDSSAMDTEIVSYRLAAVPATGDASTPLLWGLCALSAGIVLLFLLRRARGAAGRISLLLALVLALGGAVRTPDAGALAEAEVRTVSKTVQLGGKSVTLTA